MMWHDSPRVSVEHKFKCTSECWDTGWVDSLLASRDITTVCGPTADFTLVTPVSSSPCPGKNDAGDYLYLYRNTRYGLQFGTDFHEIYMVDAGPPCVNPIIFGNNRPNRTTDIGENVPPKPVFLAFIQPVLSFFRLKAVFGTPFPTEKVLLSFVVWCPFTSKMVMSLHVHFRKYYYYYYFWKICLMKNI